MAEASLPRTGVHRFSSSLSQMPPPTDSAAQTYAHEPVRYPALEVVAETVLID